MPRVTIVGAVLGCIVGLATPVAADDGLDVPSDPPSIGAEVELPPGGGGPRPDPGDGGSGGGARPEAEEVEADGGPVVPTHPGLTYEECVALLQFSEDREACQLPPEPGAPPPPPGAPPVHVIDPAALAQEARETVELPLPQPHTSPPEDGFQLVGLETWFWLDAASWQPVTARAELPGIWAEVTATPTSATWTPGDGGAAVVCPGPGAAHPGTAGAATDCGHTYVDLGTFTVAVEVTFAVTWRASNGTSGTQPPIVVSAAVPIRVEQRQAVIDG